MTAGTSGSDRAGEDMLSHLMAMLSAALWEWDLEHDRVRYVGTEVELAGYPLNVLPTDLEGLFELIHEQERAAARRALDDYVSGRADRYRVEYRLRQADGSYRWLLARGRIVARDADGRPLRLLGLFTDIDVLRRRELERSRLESQLRHVQKLDALGQLTGGIAHDFNNILASVLGYAELGLLESSSPRSLEYFKEVARAAERGRDLIAKLLVFTRAGADSQQSGVTTSLGIVPDTLRMLRPMLPATLHLEVDAAPALSDVQMDASALQQLVLNLAINARDAVGENGRINVVLRRGVGGPAVCASCGAAIDRGPDWIELAVADDGSGMTEEIRSRIFDPFYSTKESGRGSGLGLSVVHGIVHEHGGHILLDTDPGSGSCFTVLLQPAASSAPAAVEPEHDPLPIRGGGRRLLVVDDDPAIGSFLCTLLEGHDFRVDLHQDSDAALVQFESDPERWDLVITDQSMPGLSGVELADELLALRPDLPIVICSGFSEFVDVSNARELGFCAFLQKPVSVRDLLQVLARYLPPECDRETGSNGTGPESVREN
ncbi:MAG: PAS domain-containing hybrid sensor histidine kinase/response regulator [Gammaproteobacteria bacterium]|nr:MAG: PAS domain-containing hybrid sensor histidine kinase/response regulator [Gammaproteobacteria bacterium]